MSKTEQSSAVPAVHTTVDTPPFCSVREATTLRVKPLSVYPPSHRDWCENCRAYVEEHGVSMDTAISNVDVVLRNTGANSGTPVLHMPQTALQGVASDHDDN